jgi:hypothetical protein
MQFLHCQPSVSALSFQLAQPPVACPSSRWSIVLCVAGDVNGGCIEFMQVYKWSVRFFKLISPSWIGTGETPWLCMLHTSEAAKTKSGHIY